MEVVNIIVGDWSDDGHGKTETFAIKSNITRDEIDKAYTQAIKTYPKLNAFDSICEDYEDNSIPEDLLDELKLLGYQPPKWMEKEFRVSREEFVDIYLFIVKLGNPAFEYSHVNHNELTIGGYGLFWG